MTYVEWVALLGITLCAAGSFFFALAESALFSLGKWRTQQLAEDPRGWGQQIVKLLQEPSEVLATIVFGNAFANAGVIGLSLWLGLTGWCPLSAAIAGALVLTLVAGEVVPKTLAARAPERWAIRLVRPIGWLKRASLPLRRIAERITAGIVRSTVPASWRRHAVLTDEEYQELLEMAYQQGTLARAERDLILQIIRLDRRTAKDVMKPRATMASIPDDAPVEEMIQLARRYQHRRLPLYDETPDTIVGILNTRAFLLDPESDLSEAIEFPSFVPESMNLLQLFRSFQRQRRGMAIVVDEFGGTAGLVTTEDILEEVVGEIRSEAETEGFALRKMEDGRWRASGTTPLEDFAREYPELGEVRGVDTLGGLLVRLLGVVPAQGDSAVFRGLRLTATAVDERRVRELVVESIKKKGAG